MFRSDQGPSPVQLVFVRANQASSATDILLLILQALGPGGHAHHRPPAALLPVELIDRVTERVRERAGEEHADHLIVLEDVTAAAGSQLFGALRDEVWQVGAQWLVTTSSSHALGLRQPPADVFFESTIELGSLTPDEGAELLRRRLTEGVFSQLREEVPASALETPRRLLEVARELTAEPTVGAGRLNVRRAHEARAAALAALNRPVQMLAQELEALGWASASDEQLLGRLGWTRPRVVQVMSELERGGLVDMREESTGRGRPRKLYRLRPALDFLVSADAASPNKQGPS